MNAEVLQLVTEWFARTELVLKRRLIQERIGDTGELAESLRNEVHRRAGDLIAGEIEFLVRGRMVDMGAGSKSNKIESRESNRRATGGGRRRAKKWYSRAFWGRINDLQGVLGYTLMEEALQAASAPLKELNPSSRT